MNKKSDNYNLENRTARFSGEIILFLRKLEKNIINNPLVSQLVRSATSIGANYCEATGASSKKDFKNKIYICKKECKETKYWLEIIAKANPLHKEDCRVFWKEAQELTMIFSKTILTLERREIQKHKEQTK